MSQASSGPPSQRLFPAIRHVFLDRDGVINRKPKEGEYVANWGQFHLLPGAEAAIAKLNRQGRTVIVVSNQRGIALDRYTEADLLQIHRQLLHHLAEHHAKIDAFYFCPHDEDQCDCRKPGTGMIEQAFRDFPQASPANSILIGDSLSDIQAARAAAMPSIFIQGDPEHRKPGAAEAASLANAAVHSLAEAVDLLP